ncbi:hypothetical protein [Clavibacter michiganensis]|uniref:hypothetical protein n=1 Tax=Clavibacter michiganensis TaxID=28447 RepID=UPI0013653E68|nr:hypothetical protein [Clavibacter michiganensis]
MWDLKKGRNDFGGKHGMMPGQNFWFMIMTKYKQAAHLADPANAQLWDWAPDQANCGELDNEVKALFASIPPSWRDFLSSIFVGRMLTSGLHAEGKQREGAAWIGLSLQYTAALGAYITAFDRVRKMYQTQVAEGSIDSAAIAAAFDQIALSRTGWADPEKYVGAHPELSAGPDGRTEAHYAVHVTNGEMFTVCHEMAHFLLGHQGKYSRSDAIEDHLAETLRIAGLHSFVFDRPRSHTDEFLSDLLGLQLATTPRGDWSTEHTYSTMIGAICALLAEADVNNHWLLDDPEGHPATIDRISLLLAMMPHMIHVAPAAGSGSVANLRRQLATTASACMQYSMNSRAPETYSQPSWDQLHSAYAGANLALAVPAAPRNGTESRFFTLPGSSLVGVRLI